VAGGALRRRDVIHVLLSYSFIINLLSSSSDKISILFFCRTILWQAVHRVGETLFIDQPPPAANQSWCGREASAPGDRDGGGGGGGDGSEGSDAGGCSHAPGDSPSLHAEAGLFKSPLYSDFT
jgi:hypothetical protein